MCLDFPDAHTDQLAVEARRAGYVADTKLDLDEPRRHRREPSARSTARGRAPTPRVRPCRSVATRSGGPCDSTRPRASRSTAVFAVTFRIASSPNPVQHAPP